MSEFELFSILGTHEPRPFLSAGTCPGMNPRATGRRQINLAGEAGAYVGDLPAFTGFLRREGESGAILSGIWSILYCAGSLGDANAIDHITNTRRRNRTPTESTAVNLDTESSDFVCLARLSLVTICQRST